MTQTLTFDYMDYKLDLFLRKDYILRPILIKITQCHCPVRVFLQNDTTDFDETLHVA